MQAREQIAQSLGTKMSLNFSELHDCESPVTGVGTLFRVASRLWSSRPEQAARNHAAA
jgi:hypothetical protein